MNVPSLIGIVCFLLVLCWAASGNSDVAKDAVAKEAIAKSVDLLLSKLPDGGYMISLDENNKPFVAANLTANLTGDATVNNASTAVNPSASAKPNTRLLAPRDDQWGVINGEVVNNQCYWGLAQQLGDYCNEGGMVSRAVLLITFQILTKSADC